MKDWDFDNPQIAYRADNNPNIESAIQYGAERYRDFGEDDYLRAWKPSIFMRRSESRILLEITELKREELFNITEADAIREGFKDRGAFFEYFYGINKKIYDSFGNPEVLVIGFNVLEGYHEKH